MFWLGALLCTVGGLWIVVNAFRTSGALWGLGSLFIPLVGLIYAFLNLADNKLPLLLYAAGIVMCVMGYPSLVEQAIDQAAMMEAMQAQQ